MFVESPVSNPALRQMGFCMQRIIGFKTNSKMRALGGDKHKTESTAM
jgi:hypothetical protein